MQLDDDTTTEVIKALTTAVLAIDTARRAGWAKALSPNETTLSLDERDVVLWKLRLREQERDDAQQALEEAETDAAHADYHLKKTDQALEVANEFAGMLYGIVGEVLPDAIADVLAGSQGGVEQGSLLPDDAVNRGRQIAANYRKSTDSKEGDQTL